MLVYNLTRRCLLASRCREARGFWQRMRGLLGRHALQEGEGLLLHAEKMIHTFFMGFPIDVIYVDRGLKVVHLTPCMRPFRLGPLVWQAAYVLELPTGTIERTGTSVGDQLEFRRQDDVI